MSHPPVDVSPPRNVGRERAARVFATVAEWVVIGLLVLIYAASFKLTSPVNGLGAIDELFGQDSKFIIEALRDGIPYQWNGQNHILYHWLTAHGAALWTHFGGGGVASVFVFLKGFTAATGLCFLLAFRALLRELGLRTAQRLAFLPLIGLSLGSWFHFSAFETTGLTLPFLLLALTAFVRRVRGGDDSIGNRLILVGSLLVAFWIRSDQWRMPLAFGVAMFAPGARSARRSLFVDLVVFAVLAPLGFALISSSYYHVSLWRGLMKIAERHDGGEMALSFMKARNLTPRKLWMTARADGLYSIVMPRGDYRYPFGWGVGGLLRSPLGAAALLCYLGLLGRTIFISGQRAIAGDAYHIALWFSWISGWLFYCWFNPVEPFLWVVQFGVLILAALADTLRDTGKRLTVAVAVTGVLVAAHNTLAFWATYQ